MRLIIKKKKKVNTPKPFKKFVNYYKPKFVNTPKKISTEPTTKDGTKEANKNIPQMRDDKKHPHNVPENESWLEKVVRNPKTGNMVNVKSLPPEFQEKYREKWKRKQRVKKKLSGDN